MSTFGVSVFVWLYYLIFFFKQKTAYEMRISDWSSDVCSSDLRDRRGGEREEMHVVAHRLERLFLADAEALFLVDDHQAQILESDVLLQQPVGADDHVDPAFGQPVELGLVLLGALEARQHLDPDRPVGEAVAEVAVMLFGQQRGRYQHRDLPARGGGDERGAYRNLGLAEADVAADHAIHRLRAGQVADHRLDRAVLVGRLLEREGGRERFVHRPVDVDRQPRARLALGLDVEQFGGHVADFFRGLAPGLSPLLAAERMTPRGFRRSTRVASDQLQLRRSDERRFGTKCVN